MSIPASTFTGILEDQYQFRQGRWLEIEGLPFAIGTFQATSGFFSGRASTGDRFLGIAQSLREKPRTLEQTLDVLTGGAETSGQVEFEVVDVPANGLSAAQAVDGSPIQWTGQSYSSGARLSAAITAAATTIPILGSTADFTAGQYCYIGTEAIQIGTVGASSLTGCTRARFRSRAKAFPIGMPVTSRPTVMANRRVWFYQNAALQSETLTGAGATSGNQLLRFAGILRNLRLKDGEYGSFVLPARTIDQELDHECFRQFRSFVVKGTSIMDAAGKNGFHTAPGLPGFAASRANNEVGNIQTTRGFVTDDYYLFKIDDEYFIGQIKSAGVSGFQKFVISHRGVFNTAIVAHAEGSVAQECIVVGKNSTIHNFFRASKFSSPTTANNLLNADHPLLLLLQIMLSTGDGTNTAGGSTRNYDVLPAEWGMGIDYTRVDITGIEAAAAEEPQLRFGGVIDAPVNFLQLMRQLLGFSGYYYFSDLQDQLRMRRLRPPLPDFVTQSILDSHRIRSHVTGWDGNYSGAVREVHFKHNFNIRDSKYERVTVFITAADIYAKGLARSIKYECPLVYNGAAGVPGAPPMYPWDVDQWLLTRRDFYKLRYGKPPTIISERVDLSRIRITIGDLVTVVHDNLPNETTGARGLNAIGEVIGRAIDDASNTINLRILMTGYQLGDYRFISPSLRVTATTAYDDTNFNGSFAANDFTSPVAPDGTAQTDDRVAHSGGGVTSAFKDTGGHVRIWRADFSDSIKAETDSIGGGTFAITNVAGSSEVDGMTGTDFFQSGGHVNGVGMFITFDDYDASRNDVVDEDSTAPVAAEERYGYGADANDKLGTVNTDAHILFPT